jgi:SAM-dependent methyltransferase
MSKSFDALSFQATNISVKTSSNESSICPNCEKGVMTVFYEVKDIPVHSVLLMPTRERALSYPRRDLKLGFCNDCGFISNIAFDPSVHEYSMACEESQGFSPTFNAFARSLAERWVNQYQLRGRTVLEIGCGKGEFLALLVEMGMAEGIGIDPAFIPERLDTPVARRLRFIQDLYGERHTHLSADVVCCRHTLEHISPTSEFMRTVRRTIGDKKDTLLLFELPDVHRVLREAAFWDIYYEHCSYFTTGSLARLFRKHDFDLLELELEYDGQYIVIAGCPSNKSGQLPLDGEADLDDIADAVANFPGRFRDLSESWISRLNRMHSQGKRVVMWGGGSKAVSFITTLGLDEQIDFVVDINPHKHGKFVPGSGHEVRNPEELKDFHPDCVILMNPVYKEEVRKMLESMRLTPQILAV